MIGIQCPYSFNLLTNLYKVKANIPPNGVEKKKEKPQSQVHPIS